MIPNYARLVGHYKSTHFDLKSKNGTNKKLGKSFPAVELAMGRWSAANNVMMAFDKSQ